MRRSTTTTTDIEINVIYVDIFDLTLDVCRLKLYKNEITYLKKGCQLISEIVFSINVFYCTIYCILKINT